MIIHLFAHFICCQQIEHTYAMIKPKYENLWGVVIQRIIDEKLQIVRMKKTSFDEKTASLFYAQHLGKPFFKELTEYITSGPIVAFELAGKNAIEKWREIIGPTKVEVAVNQSPHSLRALFARSTTENLCHGSDSKESASREIAIVFADEIKKEKQNNEL